MNSPQTLGQIIGLTLQVLFDEIDYENNFEVSSSYEEPHTPPYSSAVSDPSHSPIERGQRHGTRGSVWEKVGCGVCVVSGGWFGNWEEMRKKRTRIQCLITVLKEVKWPQLVD